MNFFSSVSTVLLEDVLKVTSPPLKVCLALTKLMKLYILVKAPNFDRNLYFDKQGINGLKCASLFVSFETPVYCVENLNQKQQLGNKILLRDPILARIKMIRVLCIFSIECSK